VFLLLVDGYASHRVLRSFPPRRSSDLSTLISELLAPYNLEAKHPRHIYSPPQSINLFHNGEFIGPFVYGLDFKLNMENLKREYTDRKSTRLNSSHVKSRMPSSA